MKLTQLHAVHAIVRQGYNVTAAAESLHTSQPGLSKQVRNLEQELGGAIFYRNGKTLSGLTPFGRGLFKHIERMVTEAESIRRAGQDMRHPARGTLSVATTHTQARYALPPVIRRFRERYPDVNLNLHQGTPTQIAQLAADGTADIAIATEALESFEDLVLLPCYQWNRCVVVPAGHEFAGGDGRLSLAALASEPLITYVFGFTGSSHVSQAFRQHGLEARVVLTATDAEVIKTYVREGLGVGIIARMAYDETQDRDLTCLDAGHLFASSVTSVGLRHGFHLRRFVVDFIHAFAPHLDRAVVDAAIHARTAEQRRQLFKAHLPYLNTR